MITITLPEWIGWVLVGFMAVECVSIVLKIQLLRLEQEQSRLQRRMDALLNGDSHD